MSPKRSQKRSCMVRIAQTSIMDRKRRVSKLTSMRHGCCKGGWIQRVSLPQHPAIMFGWLLILCWIFLGVAMGADGKLYSAPGNGSSVLVIDPATQTARTVPVRGLPENCKFHAVAASGGRLYCVGSRKVVAIDPTTCEASVIAELESGDSDDWHGITECGGRLYCPPYTQREVLVIDPVAGTTSKIPLGPQSGRGWQKWSGAASCGGRLYCAPVYESDVLVITPDSPIIEGPVVTAVPVEVSLA